MRNVRCPIVLNSECKDVLNLVLIEGNKNLPAITENNYSDDSKLRLCVLYRLVPYGPWSFVICTSEGGTDLPLRLCRYACTESN